MHVARKTVQLGDDERDPLTLRKSKSSSELRPIGSPPALNLRERSDWIGTAVGGNSGSLSV
ncbi:hypothetical protein BK022_19825 [Methylorubrum extorquens]|uniref:Uncharacterized protein n=1 Tax=Methylorubrum extorquens TaxID=408 RepID=A0A1S1P271_METEX|nr:hypothetical protein BK022_19825 [Methylorubrum extorquens]